MSLLAVKDASGVVRNLQVLIDAAGGQTTRHASDTKVVISRTPTITAAAYSAGNVVGGLLSFTDAVRGVDCLGGIINSLLITDKANQQVQLDLWLFDSDPSSGSTITDKTALTLSAAALIKSIGYISVSTWIAAGTGGALGQALLDLRFKLASGTTLYGILIARGTPTYASTSDITVRLVISQD